MALLLCLAPLVDSLTQLLSIVVSIDAALFVVLLGASLLPPGRRSEPAGTPSASVG